MPNPPGATAINAVIKPLTPSVPPPLATTAAFSSVNDAVIFSFAYYDPMAIQPVATGPAMVEARVFAQVAMPRSVFADWLKGTVGAIKMLQDKETFGWSELKALLKD